MATTQPSLQVQAAAIDLVTFRAMDRDIRSRRLSQLEIARRYGVSRRFVHKYSTKIHGEAA